MNSREMKQLLGVAIQVYKLGSDTTLLKLIDYLNFDDLHDLQDLKDAVDESRLLRAPLTNQVINESQEELFRHNQLGISLIPIGEIGYPKSLAMTENPPAILYVRGNLSILDQLPGVAVVGSREVSSNGVEITKRITTQLSKAGFVIVSGLAIGVDTMAHRATLQNKGLTIAVLAHGLEEAKPKQNARLGHEILENGGAWVSEYPIDRRVLKQSFVQRNRIQVGLSAGSILVEASLGSGTMTQAEFCVQAKRPMYAVVPHLPDNPLQLNCEGTQHLVDTGQAFPLRTKDDYDRLIEVMLNSKLKIQESSFTRLLKPQLF
ncbi:DNA-processing protein DprA [Aeromonas jandaei]|nr:DNA-processing protein DprA [Aeromonas jandaei]